MEHRTSLQTPKLTKRQSTVNPAQIDTTPRMEHRTSSISTIHRSNSDNAQVPEVEPRPQQRMSVRNTLDTLESDTSPELSGRTVNGPSEPLVVRPRHSRSFSDTIPALSRSEGARLSALHEDEAATLEEEEYLRSSATRPRQGTTMPPSIGRWQANDPLPDSTAGEENSAISPVNHQTTPPYNRTSVYRSSQYRDGPQNFRSTTPVEENTKITRTASSSSQTAPPSYKLMSSILGSVRRG